MGNFDFEAGRRRLAEGDVVEAIRCFLASLDVDRTHTETYVELFRAYEAAWQESGDPDVLDQMRKVALAGLRRQTTSRQRAFLQEALDRADEGILEVRRAEEDALREEQRATRRLPMIDDFDDPGAREAAPGAVSGVPLESGADPTEHPGHESSLPRTHRDKDEP